MSLKRIFKKLDTVLDSLSIDRFCSYTDSAHIQVLLINRFCSCKGFAHIILLYPIGQGANVNINNMKQRIILLKRRIIVYWFYDFTNINL